MPWSLREKAFCVRLYFSSNSYKFISNAFKNEFSTKNSPSKSRIHGWVNKFREYGSVENLNRKAENRTHSGRPASARTAQNIDANPNFVLAKEQKIEHFLKFITNLHQFMHRAKN